MTKGNIFGIIENTGQEFEQFETLAESGSSQVERIISFGQKTPEGAWLEQDRNEWVLLLKGSAGIEFDGGEKLDLLPGDYVLIPGNTRHRVTYTSSSEASVWLAFHYSGE